jgi:hypothetical protein
MIALGYVLCATLSLLALSASVSAAVRIGVKPGAELALASLVLWFGVILTPIHLLGVLNLLWPSYLALCSIALSALVFLAAARGRGVGAHWAQTRRDALATAQHALDVMRRTLHAGPLTAAALLTFILALSWTAVLTYLLPSDAWDGVWYHDLTVGYAIQQHGYGNIELPRTDIQQGNGYPRNSEMMSLWFVIFADRKFIELPSVLAAIPLALAVYCLCQRYGSEPATSLLWAVGLVLLPGARLEMRTTYIDLLFGAFLITGYYFASDPELDAKRNLLAFAALGLTLGAKGLALLAVPPLGLLALAILAWNQRKRGVLHLAGAAAAGAALLLLLGGVSYVLNWLRHDNPFYPIGMKLGPLEFTGVLPYARLDVNSFHNIADNLLSPPQPGKDFADTRVSGYGLFGFFVVPLALLAAVALGVEWVRLVLRSAIDKAPAATLGRTSALVAISVVAAVGLWKSAAIWAARYNLGAVAVAVVLVHWFSRRFARPNALSFGAATAAFVTNVAMWWWSDPGWGPKGIVSGVGDVVKLMQTPRVERAGTSPLHEKSTVLARERELGPGDLVIWSDDCEFPSLLWNERHSNALEYRPASGSPERFVDDAERSNARWLVATAAQAAVLKSRPERWQFVGLTHQNHGPEPIFRRVR